MLKQQEDLIKYAGRMETPWNEAVVTPCSYVFEGEEVVAARDGRGERVVVITAAGYHACIRFVRDGHEEWRHVRDLARRKSDA